eukprot:6089990-Prorocentrum_lima.AAC.1
MGGVHPRYLPRGAPMWKAVGIICSTHVVVAPCQFPAVSTQPAEPAKPRALLPTHGEARGGHRR